MRTAFTTATRSVLTVLGVAALGLAGATAAHADDAPNTVPDAWDDSYGMVQGSTLTVDAASGILANDTDPDGDLLTVGYVYNYDAAELTVNADGSFSFTPAAGFIGVATFNYNADDGHQHWSYSRTVSITVEAAPVVPVDPAPVVPATPADPADSDDAPLDTLAYTGVVSGWMAAPALALLSLGGLALWHSRRRALAV